MIIGINGYSGSGKDTVGGLIQELYPEMNWEIKKFAGKLKQIATILTGIKEEQFEDQEFKKTNLSHEWWTTCDEGHQPMTVRDFLQKLGTDGLRTGLHPNVWVNALMSDYTRPVDLELFMYANDYTEERVLTMGDDGDGLPFTGEALAEYYDKVQLPNWIITDTRFQNEAEAIKTKGGIVIRIERAGIKPINNHPSEIGLDDWKFDYVIDNSSSVEHLKNKIKNIFQQIDQYQLS